MATEDAGRRGYVPYEEFNNEGGAAFPAHSDAARANEWHGMSLREWFAGQALAGLVGGKMPFAAADAGNLAWSAFLIADAMIYERLHGVATEDRLEIFATLNGFQTERD